ncbi:unnamed protein product [Menidia menidia]|uniref:(Atlantic silverside) hypothetical protein n=1 Tax=Menidia menidia TaxID=238744 RepID=A0A8S4BRI3_9TELE|nr:unnamed protein product [Menidia menidia]
MKQEDNGGGGLTSPIMEEGHRPPRGRAWLALLVGLGGDGQQDGLWRVLEKCSSVLSLALLDPVAVDLESAGVYELADGLDRVRVAADHLFGDGLGTPTFLRMSISFTVACRISSISSGLILSEGCLVSRRISITQLTPILSDH